MQLFYRTGYIFRYILRLLFGLSIIGFVIYKIYGSKRFTTIRVYVATVGKLNDKEQYDFIQEFHLLLKKYTDKGNK